LGGDGRGRLHAAGGPQARAGRQPSPRAREIRAMSLLQVKGLSRHFGALKAVDDISFTLEEGTILGFIGPNGAGKSTTMRILATLDVPTHGQVLLDGKSVVDSPDRVRPLLGYMPDRYGTYDDMTVVEFLDFFARAYGLK